MTDTPKAVEVNCTTGVVTERDLTPDEIAAQKAAALAAADQQAAAVAAAKEAAHTKLAALGLTAEEIAALSK